MLQVAWKNSEAHVHEKIDQKIKSRFDEAHDIIKYWRQRNNHHAFSTTAPYCEDTVSGRRKTNERTRRQKNEHTAVLKAILFFLIPARPGSAPGNNALCHRPISHASR